jgi:dipeptide/tripeptide permease
MSGPPTRRYSVRPLASPPDREFAYFGLNGLVAIVIGLVLLALSPWIARRMEGVH